MKEHNIRNIIKYGIESPSAGFTDELMEKIVTDYSIIRRTRSAIVLLSLGCLACSLLLILLITFPEFNVYGYTFRLSPVIIQVPGTLFLLYQVSQIYRIHEFVTKLNNLKLTNNLTTC